jgi:TRAP-type C4-dicarboxylate transport system substrate-binding protein
MSKMIRYSTIISMGVALAVGLVFGSADISGAQDQPIKLKYQGKWVGNQKMAWAAEQLKFTERVKATTGGKVVIENVDEVMADNEIVDGVKRGVIDIGAQPVHNRGEAVLPNFISMPFWGNKYGVQYMGMNYFLPQNLFTSKPCATFDDLKKMKLRINGALLVQMFKAAGGSPIVMNQSEVFTSAQRGVIDGAQTAVPGYLDSGLYEVCKYMSTWPLGGMGLAVMMNKDSWNKLGPTLQGQVMAAWNETEKAQFIGAQKDVSEAEAKAKSLGAQRMDPSKAEQDKFASFAGPVVADWKTKAGAESAAVMKVVNEVMGTNF